MVRLTRIYTKIGDDGTTRLVDGSTVSKSDRRVTAYGNLDELSSQIGVVICELERSEGDCADTRGLLRAIQQDLFDMGSLLATPLEAEFELPPITDEHVAQLELFLDHYNDDLSHLKSFILPGGHICAAHLHVARTICRRAEREVVGLAGVDQEGRRILHYLNRLSDLLFVLARWVNARLDHDEPLWEQRSGTVTLQAPGPKS